MCYEFGGKNDFYLVEVWVSLLSTCYFFVFLFFSLAWKMNYLMWGQGGLGGDRKVNKTHVYCSLSRYDSKRVWVSWDFNLLIKMMHLKTPFQSSFSWCLQTKKVFQEERHFSKLECWKFCVKNGSIHIISGTPQVYAQYKCVMEMCALDIHSHGNCVCHSGTKLCMPYADGGNSHSKESKTFYQ